MISQKKIILYSAIVLILAMAGSGIFWLWRKIQNGSRLGAGNGGIILDFKSCETIPEGEEFKKDFCLDVGYEVWTGHMQAEAYNTKNQALCEAIIIKEKRESCLTELAILFPNTEICKGVTDEFARQACEENVSVASGDFAHCHILQDEAERDTCYLRMVVHAENPAQFCSSLTATDQNICFEIIYTRQALAQTDYSVCRKIATTEGRQRCLNKMPPDTDHDGLSDYMEKAFFLTDPNKRDTDGDGYDDGTEIKNGHDPLK
jgi:hypothetical protein